MYYVIEAVRWSGDGHMSHVRWHSVDTDGEVIVKSQPSVVRVVDAAKQCSSHEVRVYVGGDVGRFFKMKACPEGLDAEADGTGTPLRERMAHLPRF